MLTTENRDWGFFGTATQQQGEAFAEEAWKVAFEHITNLMGWGEERTREFLDGRDGRHYADKMAETENCQEALTRAWDLELTCRAFFKETNLSAYNSWIMTSGQTPVERTLRKTGISKSEIHNTLENLLSLNFSKSQIDAWIRTAGPMAQALAIILADIPEEIREMYTGN